MRRPRVRVLSLVAGSLAVTAIIAASTAGAGAGPRFQAAPLTPDSTFSASKSATGRTARTDASLLGRTDSAPVNVMIKYDFDPTASYRGGVNGLAATSPSATGRSLKANAAAVAAYNRYAASKAAAISTRVERAVKGAVIRQTFRTAYGGVAARVPANQISALLAIPGVSAVQRDTLEQPLDDNTSFIGATNVWVSQGGSAKAGSNVIVGVIDTGVWPEHPMLADNGLPAPPATYGCQFGDGSDAAHLGPAFACNNKLIGAYAFTATYLAAHGTDGHEFCNDATATCSPRDSEGHGTHTTTTAAGDCVASAVLYGVQRGPVCGIAPGAHVIQYRVCLSAGCFSSDSVAAVAQAIADGVNVINFSISGGANPYTDPVELAFLDAAHAGISVNASAGNSGPGAATSDHGGPWVTTVGASTGPRAFTSTLHLTADGGATFDVAGVTLTNGIGSPTPVVLAESINGGDPLCQTPLAAGSALGEIVMCRRGTNARVDKGFNSLAGGAAGMILYNPIAQDSETDNHWLPTIHVDGPQAALLSFVSSHTNVMATWSQGTPTASQADVMATFSSRGPTGDWIKPDVTAPGIQVLAGMTPQPDSTTPTNGPPGNLYQAIAGTSMSSPHAAGVSALVKAAHPSWTPAEIKSALMTSAVQTVVKEDGVTPATPFDDGAGSIRADRAVNPTLVFDETYANFVAAGSDPLHRIDLNIPSIDATTMTGSVTTHRTAINVSGHRQVFAVQITSPAGVSITVGSNNHNFKIPKGGSLTFPITISAPSVANGQYFGSIKLVPASGANPVYMPVAFVRKQGVVTLAQTCSPTSIPLSGGASHCTATVQNLGSVAANAVLQVTPDTGAAFRYKNITAPASVIGNGAGVQWSGPLSPAVAPQVDSIAPTSGPAGGYLGLSLFGIAPIAGVGDDTITNFNVPTFYYGGEPYNRLAVVSDGYLVIGGGTASDVSFSAQMLPNPARPNNVLAPYWTDLNPPAGGALRIATLTDGADTWIVVDFDHVRNFGNADTHTFEVWLRTSGGAVGAGPQSEQLTMSYGPTTGPGDPGAVTNWGAENRDGTSGKNIAAPGPASNSEYGVHLLPPTAGGQVSVGFDLVPRAITGTFNSIAALVSDQTPGTTQVVQPITITP
jgi:subtilisin family serine protease